MTAAKDANKLYLETKETNRIERTMEKQQRHDEKQKLRNDELELTKLELARQQRADDMALLTCNLSRLNPVRRMYME